MDLVRLYVDGEKFKDFVREYRLTVHSGSETGGPFYIFMNDYIIGKETMADYLGMTRKQYCKAVQPYQEDNMSPTAYESYKKASLALQALYEIVELNNRSLVPGKSIFEILLSK